MTGVPWDYISQLNMTWKVSGTLAGEKVVDILGELELVFRHFESVHEWKRGWWRGLSTQKDKARKRNVGEGEEGKINCLASTNWGMSPCDKINIQPYLKTNGARLVCQEGLAL